MVDIDKIVKKLKGLDDEPKLTKKVKILETKLTEAEEKIRKLNDLLNKNQEQQVISDL